MTNRCNVTGRVDGQLYDFHINQDFGYDSQFFDGMTFSFVLSEDEYICFISSGRQQIEENERDNCTYQYGLYFSSEQVYGLISKFQHPPKGYFNQGWLQYTDEEEQWLWDNMDKDETQILYSDAVSVKRAIELAEVLLFNK
ncbi:hypothetical protein [Paenibacillus xylaniclasticus]|uniref:hypothetical protein n=1 Tax=Paenibacillus xylaniclasticus TaxID=588083 RepID=UPI000FD907CE|nr:MULTISPECIES: hypothetical protein [Paenibacillus]GFN32434.1 hypothetical protein PCURB6_26940 [Paenibacillus curdlanolyticus]